MEQRIRDLCKGLGDVDVVRVDSASSTNFKHIIDKLSIPVPTVTSHHPPSTCMSVERLDQISLIQLQRDQRLKDSVLHVTITEVVYKHGALISVKDEDGNLGLAWSLLLRPFGICLSEGMKITIKEPYFGQCPTGDLAVCVHHPFDCVLLDISPSPTNPGPSLLPSVSANFIAVRPSKLGGRGIFATAPIAAGNPVLLEKALALADSADAAVYGDGVDGILIGERTNGRKLALLQQLVDKMKSDEHLQPRFFDLHAGLEFPTQAAASHASFDTYRALSIIKHNAHTIIPGSTSDHHDMANKAKNTAKSSANDQTPGIWLQGSMLNHSCLPNCTWAWTGDLFVARANRDVAIDEELTVAYVPTSYNVEKRKGILKASNDFDCTCPLCKADTSAARTPEVREAVTKAQRLPQHIKGASLSQRVRRAEEVVSSAALAYPRSNYVDADGAELPCVQLAEPLYHLAHVVLDRAKNGHDWTCTTADMRSIARLYFTACVEVGLGYKVVLDSYSEYCELLIRNHSQPRPIGVLALMALAELAFIDGEKLRCRALKACAKRLYGMWCGEDASFKKQRLYYKCKDEPVEKGEEPLSKEWKELKAASMKTTNVLPSFETGKS